LGVLSNPKFLREFEINQMPLLVTNAAIQAQLEPEV
jgi:hypothetical protein